MTDTAEWEAVCPNCEGSGKDGKPVCRFDTYPPQHYWRIIDCELCHGTGRVPAQEQATE